MPAKNPAPARRLRVLVSGLHQLAAKCEKAGSELGAPTKPSLTARSGWPPSASVASVATIAAAKDLAGIGMRISGRGADYASAAVAYTQTEDESAVKLRALVV